MDEAIYMKRALELARLGIGKTSPNPPVGAVVVKDDEIVGEGYHQKAGDAHAEINAMNEAGEKTRGATLYLTLEPCCHYGRTPPCADEIVKRGIKRVVIGCRDPNPLVNGKGVSHLKKAGIDVCEGLLRDECRDLIRPHEKFFKTRMPYVILKAAISLDGKIALSSGESKWITNEKSRQYVRTLRSQSDGVLVGINTVLKDDPELRPSRAIVLDEDLKIPLESKLCQRKDSSLIIAASQGSSEIRQKKIKKLGHELLIVKQDMNGYIDLKKLLSKVADMGMRTIVVEGGGKIFSSFVRLGLVDKFVLFIAPRLFGGTALDMLPDVGFGSIAQALRLNDVKIFELDDDVVVEGRF